MVDELLGDLAALACLHAASEDGDEFAGRLKLFGDGVEVVNPSVVSRRMFAPVSETVSTSPTIWSSRA